MKMISKIGFIGIFMTVFLSTCIQEDISKYPNNLILNQSFSLPIGSFTVQLSNFAEKGVFPTSISSDSFTIDGSKVTDIPLYYSKSYDFPFSINETNGTENNIKEIDFNVAVDNYFPTAIKTQVYFLDANNTIVLTLFEKGSFSIVARKEVGKDKYVAGQKSNTIKITDTQFAKLKTAITLRCQNTIAIPNSVINFSSSDSIRLQLAFTIHLDVKVKEVSSGK